MKNLLIILVFLMIGIVIFRCKPENITPNKDCANMPSDSCDCGVK